MKPRQPLLEQDRPSGRRNGRLTGWTLVAACWLACAGCGAKGPPKVTIQGTVTLDGKPLSNGAVAFVPQDPALGADGATITAGRFTITVYKGQHRVEITAFAQEQRPTPPDAPPEAGIHYRSLIPPRYNEKSTLACDVQSSKDRPVFELTSDR